jgi:hypothetical protein
MANSGNVFGLYWFLLESALRFLAPYLWNNLQNVLLSVGPFRKLTEDLITDEWVYVMTMFFFLLAF